MEIMKQVIKQLTNEIIDLKKNTGQGKKHFKSFFKKKTYMDTPPLIPPTSGINLEDYAMENFCCTHHANHSERTFSQFINSFTVMLLLQDPPKRKKKDEEEGENDDEQEEEAEEEEEEEPPSHLNLIWDKMEVDNGDDDVLEEACVRNDYNLRSKGSLKSNNSPSTLKMSMKKTPSIETSNQISPKKDKDNGNDSTAIKSTKSMGLTQNIIGDLKLDYDVVESLNKMKANITVFELCNITQLRKQSHGALQHIQGSQDVMVGNTKATLK